MYFKNFAISLLPVLTFISLCTATPIHHLDHTFSLSAAATSIDHTAISSRSFPDSIKPRHTLSKRTVPWTSLGNGWLATFVSFDPILSSAAANRALVKLYTGVATHALAKKLAGPMTPSKSVVFNIGALQFIAESTSPMEWEVIFQFVLKMRETVYHQTSSMYTAMFAHVAGHAMMFSIRIPGMVGEPIP